MSNYKRNLRPGQTPPLVLVGIVGVVIVILVFALALAGGDGQPASPPAGSVGVTSTIAVPTTSVGLVATFPPVSPTNTTVAYQTPTPTGLDHSQPAAVDQRVVSAMQANNIEALYIELSPGQQQLFPRDSFVQAEQQAIADLGRVTKVETIEPLTILTGPQWNNQWAQSRLRVVREKTTREYLVRYYLDNGQWYLYATLDVTP